MGTAKRIDFATVACWRCAVGGRPCGKHKMERLEAEVSRLRAEVQRLRNRESVQPSQRKRRKGSA